MFFYNKNLLSFVTIGDNTSTTVHLKSLIYKLITINKSFIYVELMYLLKVTVLKLSYSYLCPFVVLECNLGDLVIGNCVDTDISVVACSSNCNCINSCEILSNDRLVFILPRSVVCVAGDIFVVDLLLPYCLVRYNALSWLLAVTKFFCVSVSRLNDHSSILCNLPTSCCNLMFSSCSELVNGSAGGWVGLVATKVS